MSVYEMLSRNLSAENDDITQTLKVFVFYNVKSVLHQ